MKIEIEIPDQLLFNAIVRAFKDMFEFSGGITRAEVDQMLEDYLKTMPEE